MTEKTLSTQPAATVFELWSRVMEDVQAIGKNQRNNAPNANYNFRGIDAVMNAVGPVLRKHGVFVVPESAQASYRDVLTSTGKPSREATVLVHYRVYGPQGDSFPMCSPGEAMDSGDKGTPKAMSVAYRTVLLQALTIPTDEPDPDSQTYERAAEPARSQRQVDDHASRVFAMKQRVMAAAKRANPGKSEAELRELVPAACEARGLDKDSVADLMKLAEEWEQQS